LANGISGEWFKNDLSSGYRSFDDFLFKFDVNSSNPASASLIFGTIQRLYFLRQVIQAQSAYSQQYPIGLPNTDNYPIYYRIESVFDGLISSVKKYQDADLCLFSCLPAP